MDKIKKFLMEKPHTPRAVRRLEDRQVKEPEPAEPEISLDRIAGMKSVLCLQENVVTGADGKASAVYTAPPLPLPSRPAPRRGWCWWATPGAAPTRPR